MNGRLLSTGASILLIASGFAIAGEVKHDRTIEAAAAKIAAKKVGDIRGSIDYDDVPFLVTRKLLVKEEAHTSLLPRPAWIPPEGEEALPPMVSNFLADLDYTLTGSITGRKTKSTRRIIWDRFDADGNPIETE